MAAQNGTITSQVIETVHNDGNYNVQHDETAQENERDEVKIGDVGSTSFVRIHG